MDQMPPSLSPQSSPQRPTSIHNRSGRNWPVIVAAIGLPLICILMAVSFLLLPEYQFFKQGWERYLFQREACMEAQRQEALDDGKSWDPQKSEYRCSTIELADKYYAKDPEGVIDLCVHTAYVSAYTKDGGIGGDVTAEELDTMHGLNMMMGMQLDAEGNVTVSDELYANWSDLCRGVIELNQEVKLPR